MSHRTERLLSVGALARVEGEGALRIRIRDGEVAEAELAIYEPPRYFEALLRGRRHTEPPDLTARICGICPVAYQMSACRAVEDACGVTVDGPLAELRRLLYFGEWIESHTLHVYLLHAPDFLHLPDALALARTEPALLARGLRLKKAGNEIVESLGGRAIHPVNVRVGGFHRLPERSELDRLAGLLRQARTDAEDTLGWVSGFEFPELTVDHELLALGGADGYAIDSGTPTGSRTGPFPVAEFTDRVRERQVPHSTALHATLAGRPHLTGPLARWNLNGSRLPADVRELAARAGLTADCRNPFRSILIRAVEVLWAVTEAQRIIERYRPPSAPAVEVPARAGTGHGATEAPRGLLYHRYELDRDGLVRRAVIIPPTAQNQGAIEADLRVLVQSGLHLDDEELTRRCERAIRNHDPCISCAAHFLTLTVEGRGDVR